MDAGFVFFESAVFVENDKYSVHQKRKSDAPFGVPSLATFSLLGGRGRPQKAPFRFSSHRLIFCFLFFQDVRRIRARRQTGPTLCDPWQEGPAPSPSERACREIFRPPPTAAATMTPMTLAPTPREGTADLIQVYAGVPTWPLRSHR